MGTLGATTHTAAVRAATHTAATSGAAAAAKAAVSPRKANGTAAYGHKPSATTVLLSSPTYASRAAASAANAKAVSSSPTYSSKTGLQLKKAAPTTGTLLNSVAEGVPPTLKPQPGPRGLAARPKTGSYYRETDFGVGFQRGYGRTASTQLKTLSPNTAGLANPAHPPRTTSEMEFVKLGATFELPG